MTEQEVHDQITFLEGMKQGIIWSFNKDKEKAMKAENVKEAEIVKE